jgi:hypothetical protein
MNRQAGRLTQNADPALISWGARLVAALDHDSFKTHKKWPRSGQEFWPLPEVLVNTARNGALPKHYESPALTAELQAQKQGHHHCPAGEKTQFIFLSKSVRW